MKKPSSTVFTMMLLTLCAKAAGLFRNVLMAREFGISEEAVAFSAASHIPLSFFDLLFSAAILGCFIPVYNGFAEGDEKKKDAYAVTFFSFVSLLCAVLALLGIAFAPVLVSLASPGLSGETEALAVTLLRILFPMILFAAQAYTLVGILQSKGRFLLPASISLFSNGLIVLYLLFVNPHMGGKGIYVLAGVYLLAWLVQFLTLFLPLLRSGFPFALRFEPSNEALRRSLKMTPPIMIGSWLLPAGWLVGTFFSSMNGVLGGVTVFDYANNAYLMIAGILTYSICNYIFPRLSRLSARESAFGETTASSLFFALLLILPCLFALPALGDEVVAVLYLGDAFTKEAASLTSPVFKILCCAMPFFAVNEILSRAFYSRRSTRPPMFAAIVGVGCNIAVCLLSHLFLPASMVGVALGALAAQLASALFLLLCALKDGTLSFRLFPRLAWLLAAVLPATGGGFLVRLLFGGSAFDRTKLENAGIGTLTLAASLLLYALALWLLRQPLFAPSTSPSKGDNADG